jgi:hypothetical protein
MTCDFKINYISIFPINICKLLITYVLLRDDTFGHKQLHVDCDDHLLKQIQTKYHAALNNVYSWLTFYVCFDWFKELRLFSYVMNLKVDVVLKASRAVVIRRFSLNEAP